VIGGEDNLTASRTRLQQPYPVLSELIISTVGWRSTHLRPPITREELLGQPRLFGGGFWVYLALDICDEQQDGAHQENCSSPRCSGGFPTLAMRTGSLAQKRRVSGAIAAEHRVGRIAGIYVDASPIRCFFQASSARIGEFQIQAVNPGGQQDARRAGVRGSESPWLR
jgi:hypothetical protein